jgi:hypothetical protein
MKNLIVVFTLLSVSSAAMAGQSVVCSIKSDSGPVRDVNVDGVATVDISKSRSVTILMMDQEVRIELNRPATQDEIARALRLYGRTISEMPVAYTQVNNSQMASSAVLMAEDIKVACRQK